MGKKDVFVVVAAAVFQNCHSMMGGIHNMVTWHEYVDDFDVLDGTATTTMMTIIL